MDLSLFVAGTAFFDSVSTTQQIVFLILLFSVAKPVRTSLAFILGVVVAYLVCGLIGLALVDKLNAMVHLFLPDLATLGDANYYQAQALLGLVLLAAGPLYWWFQARSGKGLADNRMVALLQRMNPVVALVFGAFLSITSFPFALPYVAAIEKIAASGLSPAAQAGQVLLYNAVYALPLLLPFGLFVALREGILHGLHRHVHSLNLVLTVVLLSGMGLVLLVDSGLYFATGHAWMPTRFL